MPFPNDALLLELDEICVLYFGPNPNPFKVNPETKHRKSNPHPKYWSMWRIFKDAAIHIGAGTKKKRYGVPRRIVEAKLGALPKKEAA